MITGIAFIALALLLFCGIGWYAIAGQMREAAALGRRLDAVLPGPALAATRRALPASVPEMIAPLLARAQIEISRRDLGIGLAALVIATLLALLQGPVLALIVLIVPPALLLAWLRRRAGIRIEALVEALPYYVDGVRQLQAVGNSLPQALLKALPDSPPAVQSYLAPVARRLELGAPVADTMRQFAERLRVPEIAMLASAVRTNIRYGGSVAAILTNLAGLLRERSRVKRDLRAATSEIRVSSKVLIAMPFVAVVPLMFLNPSYITFFFHDPRGSNAGLFALAFEGLGILAMRLSMRLEF